ncbi:uncharacterized protein LOC128158029 isoform X2 [Crassostrea angulata]|uniref:uncharacterized protein LOC128158029 isoform X2 n=1 Tax=Magallana angulata TaxID=2784310 RepID=UPI0022B21CA3|nr:uncharacterized protein LOC128158029 isoform X2 [Crassostrea angulata]
MFFYIVLSFTFLAHFGETSDKCLLVYDPDVLHVSGRCYWTVSGFTSFADAHKHCQNDGGMLAEIPDQSAQTEIKKWLENNQNYWTRIWIGVNDMNEEGNFENMLNETVNYTNWASGEPNNAISLYCGLRNGCDCVMIISGKWYDTPCSLFLSYPALCSQRYNITLTTEQTSKPLVHTSTLSTITTTTTDLSTKYQTSEKNTDHLTTKNHITVSQTSEQITSKSTTTDLTTVFQTYEQLATQSTTTDLLPMSQTNEELATQSTTTYQSKVSQTSDQTSTLSSTQLTNMDHTTISQTSVQTFTQPATDSPSILQTSMQTFSRVQSTVGTTLHVNQQRECMCPCSRMKNLVIIKNEAKLLTKIKKMKKELAVNKSSLSSSIRKKTSAVDPRPSASIVGGTISVVIIATVVGLIVLSDLTRVINFCWKTISKRWYEKRKSRVAQKGKV